MLTIFRSCDPQTKSKLIQSFCLSLYGSALWMASLSELYSLAVSFNNLLRKIWSLPCRCHTVILHCVGGLNGIYNIVIARSNKRGLAFWQMYLLKLTLVYTSLGYNHLNSACHWKSYTDCEKFCASFIHDAKMNPDLNQHLTDDINYMCCA